MSSRIAVVYTRLAKSGLEHSRVAGSSAEKKETTGTEALSSRQARHSKPGNAYGSNKFLFFVVQRNVAAEEACTK